jgi:hypothetical protein
MNTDYISYYFSPLVSMWYLIVYVTMAIGAQLNERTPVLLAKIIISMAIVTYFMSQTWLLQTFFDFLERVCSIRWSAREWNFRVSLDLWIVYFGMFAAVAVIKIREHRLTDHQYWPSAVKAAIAMSGVVMIWFFVFELLQESKFKYNLWHPYISFLPVASFAILRNANPILRSASSRAFAFIGTCSLETFIIQYHFWLAADTKGVLLIIPGTRWRPVNFVLTSVMFVYVSHRVALASGEITTWICGGAKKTLPTINPNAGAGDQAPFSSTSRRVGNASEINQEFIPLIAQNEQKDANGHEHPPADTLDAPRRWVDRLADDAASSSHGFSSWFNQIESKLGLKTKLAVGLGAMWLVNVLWSYP